MTQAYRMIVRQHGGPDVIEREDMDTPVLAHGQVLVATAPKKSEFLKIKETRIEISLILAWKRF